MNKIKKDIINSDSKKRTDQIYQIIDDMKGQDIEVIYIQEKSSIADYLIICTGTSDVHVRSISDKIMEKMIEHGIKPLRKDLKSEGWVLIDYADIIVHVMKEETRQFYDLESLWNSKIIDPDSLEYN